MGLWPASTPIGALEQNNTDTCDSRLGSEAAAPESSPQGEKPPFRPLKKRLGADVPSGPSSSAELDKLQESGASDSAAFDALASEIDGEKAMPQNSPPSKKSRHMPLTGHVGEAESNDTKTDTGSGQSEFIDGEESSFQKGPAGQPRIYSELARFRTAKGGAQHNPALTEPESPTSSCDESDSNSATQLDSRSGRPQPSYTPLAGKNLDDSAYNVHAGDTSQSESSHHQSNSPKEVETPDHNFAVRSSGTSIGGIKHNKPKPKSPRQIGPRRSRTVSMPVAPARRPPTYRPELICRQLPDSLSWNIVLAADDRCQINEVWQNDKQLDRVNGQYRLASFAGRLSILYGDGTGQDESLFDGKCGIFKLRKYWTGDGRKVGCITNGYFIVVAPNEWIRTGHIPVEQRDCTDMGFTAHYFFRDGKKPNDDIGRFKESELQSASSGFELAGERVFDDSGEGDLFVGAVPEMKVSPGITWARVGAEEENGWQGMNFRPGTQKLAEALHGRQGRFFVRVYDESGLRDSDQFRYLRDLLKVLVNGELYTELTILAPPSTGYSQTNVRFIGVDDLTIDPIRLPKGFTRISEQGVNLIGEPHPSMSSVSFTLACNSGHVDLALNLLPYWWRMERDGTKFGRWCDTPLVMTRQEFREHAAASDIVRLRLPQRIESAAVGFGNELAQGYPSRYSEMDGFSATEIRLTDFVDYSEIDQRLNEEALLKAKCDVAELTLIRVLADPVPAVVALTCSPATIAAGEHATLLWTTKNAEGCGVVICPEFGSVESSGGIDIMPSETTTYTLRISATGMDNVSKAVTVTVSRTPRSGENPIAYVKLSGGGWRPGKGFSYGELKAAGLTTADAALRPIPVDKRRRSLHLENIKTIRRLVDA